HEISRFDQLCGRIAPRNDDVRHGWLFALEKRQHVLDTDVAVTDRDVELVEQDQPNVGVPDQLFCLFPGRAGVLDIALAILRFPGEALTHGMELAKMPEMLLDQLALTRRHGALDELNHR